jgi:hypothetical protein
MQNPDRSDFAIQASQMPIVQGNDLVRIMTDCPDDHDAPQGPKKRTAANDNKKLGDVYTFAEAAAKLRVSPRAFHGIIRKFPHYAKNGRVYLFSDSDILAIWESMRCASTSTNELRVRTSTSASRTPKVTRSSNLQKLFTGRPRKRSA